MALEYNFTDTYNQVNANAYVRLIKIDINRSISRAVLKFDVYKDATTRNGSEPNNKPIKQEVSVANGADFDGYFEISVLDGYGFNPFERGYEYAKSINLFPGASNV